MQEMFKLRIEYKKTERETKKTQRKEQKKSKKETTSRTEFGQQMRSGDLLVYFSLNRLSNGIVRYS